LINYDPNNLFARKRNKTIHKSKPYLLSVEIEDFDFNNISDF